LQFSESEDGEWKVQANGWSTKDELFKYIPYIPKGNSLKHITQLQCSMTAIRNFQLISNIFSAGQFLKQIQTTGNLRINVTLRHVRVTIVALEKQ
jgi:hypothetical protein